MNFEILSSLFTVLSMLVFLGILFWAYGGPNKAKFESLGQEFLVNDDDKDNDHHG